MSGLYQTSFRGYLIDHHSPAPPAVTLEHLDVEEYREFFRAADINNLMLYCKDHWGYSYYNTSVGTMHPALKQDWVGTVSRVLREEGIEFNAYYCLEYDTLAPKLHPEWSIRDAKGDAVSLKGRMAKWGMPCYETGYRSYVLAQLAEIVRNYHPDSLFLDIFGKSLCYCPACRAKFQSQFGYALPMDFKESQDEFHALDFGEAGRDVNLFLENCASDMLDDVLNTVKRIVPTLKVTINFAALYPEKIRRKLDYQFTEPWAGNWLSAAYSRDTAKGGFPQLGPGDVSEVYNYRHQNIYTLAAAQIAAAGCRVFLYSGSQHVDGTLEHEEAQRIGKAYQEVARFESYLSNRKLVADVAIIQSDLSSTAKAGNRVVMNAIGRCKQSDSHREAILGAMKCCDAANVAWTVLPEREIADGVMTEAANGVQTEAAAGTIRKSTTGNGLKNLSAYRVVILAGLYHVSPELAEALRAYVRQGGTVVADGECGLYEADGRLCSNFALSDLLGCDYGRTLDEYAAAEWGGYIKPEEHPIWSFTPDTLPPVGSTQIGVTATTAVSLGQVVPPTVALTEKTWVNWWCPPPAVSPSEFPAVLENRIGTGRVLYLAYDFFRGRNKGFHLTQSIFDGIMSHLLPNPSIRLISDIPETVGFMAYRRKRELIVHNLSNLAEKTGGDAPPVKGGTLRLAASVFPVANARVVFPECCTLPFRIMDGWVEFELPMVEIHQIIVIALED